MPEYVYRREDGTHFTIKQRFNDDPLIIDPKTGQRVVRVVQPSGIIFKGSGFYVNDSRGSKQSLSGNGSSSHSEQKSIVKKDDETKDIVKKKDEPKSVVKTDD
jgi:predicted nucleic acid-binding Zn ribbon protein